MIVAPESMTPQEIGDYYDQLDLAYRLLWGCHLHHGYWTRQTRSVDAAVTHLIDLTTDWLRIRKTDRLLDIGCGYGATGRYLNHRFSCHVTGITVSRHQFDLGRDSGEAGGVQLRFGDYLNWIFPKPSFDGVLALESFSHFANKKWFFQKVSTELKPGARLVMTDLVVTPTGADRCRKWLLQPLCQTARIPSLAMATELHRWAQRAGLKTIITEDLTPHVRRTWSHLFLRSLRHIPSGFFKARESLPVGSRELAVGLNAIRLWLAYRMGAVEYRLHVYEKNDPPL